LWTVGSGDGALFTGHILVFLDVFDYIHLLGVSRAWAQFVLKNPMKKKWTPATAIAAAGKLWQLDLAPSTYIPETEITRAVVVKKDTDKDNGDVVRFVQACIHRVPCAPPRPGEFMVWETDAKQTCTRSVVVRPVHEDRGRVTALNGWLE